MSLRVGSGLPNIQKKDVYKFEIQLPSFNEQHKITEVLFSAQQEIDLLKQLLSKYQTQKRGLMQKLLTGEWRIK
jgi:type I restriction enzyme S subunit